jgi:hypothetical protein
MTKVSSLKFFTSAALDIVVTWGVVGGDGGLRLLDRVCRRDWRYWKRWVFCNEDDVGAQQEIFVHFFKLNV